MHAMNPSARTLLVRLAVIAGASTLALLAGALSAGPASAAPPCAERVIDDWSDDGRIDRLYPLDCYEAALDAIPVDLRDYTNAADVIGRALTAAARERPPGGTDGASGSQAAPDVDSSGASSFPVPLLVLVGVSAVVIAAGTAGHFSRRRRAAHSDEAPD